MMMRIETRKRFRAFAMVLVKKFRPVRFLWYVLREAKRALVKKYTRYYLLALLILCVFANLAMVGFRAIYGMNDGAFSYNLIIFAEGAFVIPYYSCIFLADMVFGREYPDPHIKDGITVGLRRWQLYLGKLLASVVLGIILFFAAFIMLLVTTSLFGIGEAAIGMEAVKDFLQKACVAFPLWMAGIAIAECFLFSTRSKKRAFIMFFITVLLVPRLIILLASERIALYPFTALMDILITPQFQALQFYFTMNPAKCTTLGIVYSAAATVAGIIMFYKKTS